MLRRLLIDRVTQRLRMQPAVVLLGPRQVGKTTLAREIAAHTPNALFLDLEHEADRARLAHPGLFFPQHRDRLVILDEVQTMPNLFSALRPEIEAARRPGRFLLLGSASGALLHQSAESLAGRVSYQELTPLLLDEINPAGVADPAEASRLWLCGGFPSSYLAEDNESSFLWRDDFISTFLARELPQLGVTIPSASLRRFWTMCAHLHGQVFNASQLGLALGGVAHTTVGRYLDLMVDALMLRSLPPWFANIGKRLTKSPKVYFRDSGLLHTMLGIRTLHDLAGHPVAGLSWEGFVIEQILAALPPQSNFGFYRTAAGAELDLVVEYGRKRIAFEIKLSNAPKVSRGFWQAVADLELHHAYIIAPIAQAWKIADNIEVIPPMAIRQIFS